MANALSNRAFGRVGRLLAPLCVAAALLSLTGCETLGYYGQAVAGQWHILASRESIDDLIESPRTPAGLRESLSTVQALRRFAAAELALPVGNQFTTYADIDRPYVVWNVFAAPEFSTQALSWCYPVAGCVSYRGYFDPGDARRKAAALAAEGHDVYVGGVTAYSTLGWFSDPLLSTVIDREEHQLARLVFHELAHQKVYVVDDTTFNESYATTVEYAGLRRWVAQSMPAREGKELLHEVERELARRERFVAIVRQAASDLEAIYARDLPQARMRELKSQRLQRLREEHEALKREWGGDSPFEAWFAADLNNAQLATVTTYNDYVPAFERLLVRCHGDFGCFHSEATALAALDAEERAAALARLAG